MHETWGSRWKREVRRTTLEPFGFSFQQPESQAPGSRLEAGWSRVVLLTFVERLLCGKDTNCEEWG